MFGFFKFRRGVLKFIRENGGMYELYKDLIILFQNEGFQLREITDDSFYLHYGNENAKAGIQLIQIKMDEAEIIVGEETIYGASNNTKLKTKTNLNPQETFNSIQAELKHVKLPCHEVQEDDDEEEEEYRRMMDEGIENNISEGEIAKNVANKFLTWDFALENDRISEELKLAIENFLIPDNISPYLFAENMRIIKDGAFYFAMPPLYNGTKSMNEFLNVPKAYPDWFAAAYPDVLVWFMDSFNDDSAYKIVVKDWLDGTLLQNNFFTSKGLKKIINLYKENKQTKFECERD